MNITKYLKAKQPCLLLNTSEAERSAAQTIVDCKWEKLTWDCRRGILQEIEGGLAVVQAVEEPEASAMEAILWLKHESNKVLFAYNMHHFLNSVDTVQELINTIPHLKANGCCLVLMGEDIKLPPELSIYFMTIEFGLPTEDELLEIAVSLCKPINVKINHDGVIAAKGLTEFEAETAFALALQQTKTLDPAIIVEQKKQMIQKTGLMEFYPSVDISEVGGLKPFKSYIDRRMDAYKPDSKLPKMKAILLSGVAGTGKSLSSKALANMLGWELIRLDVSSLKGSLVGETEKNTKTAFKVIDAFGRVVVWIDEIDKALAGTKQHTTGDTSESLLGILLTNMQESESEALFVCTANEAWNLPSPLFRRFDAVFFVDLPAFSERAEIMQIMDRRYGSQLVKSVNPEKLWAWTGAEIEQLAKDSLFDGIDIALKNIVPLSTTMSEEIEFMQKWAKTRARRANDTDDRVIMKPSERRKIA